MVKIKMMVGWYGSKEGLKGVNSAPFNVSEEEAERLCAKKVAVIVDEDRQEASEPATDDDNTSNEGQEDDDTQETDANPDYPSDEELDALNFNQLRQVAKTLGLDTTGKQEEIKERIKEARDAENPVDEIEELVLEAAEPEG